MNTKTRASSNYVHHLSGAPPYCYLLCNVDKKAARDSAAPRRSYDWSQDASKVTCPACLGYLRQQ